MSTTAHIKIDLDANKAAKQLKDLTAESKKTTKSIHDLDATFDEVYQGLKPLTARMGEQEDKLYELALAGKQASKEYQALLKSVGEYRKTQIQTDMAVDAAALTITQKLTTGLGAAAGGFAVVEGAMAAAGMESAAFEQTMQKLAGVMAVLQGINELRESLPLLQQMFGGFGNVANGATEASDAIDDLTDSTEKYSEAGTEAAATAQQSAKLTKDLNLQTVAQTNAIRNQNDVLKTQLDLGFDEQAQLEEKIKKQEDWLNTNRSNLDVTDQQITKAEQQIRQNKKQLESIKANNTALHAQWKVTDQQLKTAEKNTAAINAQTGATRNQTAATTALGKAQQAAGQAATTMGSAMKSALVGLGIGAIIAGIVYGITKLIEASQAETEAEKKAAEERKKDIALRKAQAEAAKEQREAVAQESAEFVGLIVQLKATNAQSKERETLIKQINSQYGTTLKNLADEAAFQSQLNAEVAAYIEYQKAKYRVQKNEELIAANLAKQEESRAKLRAANAEAQALVDSGARKSIEDALSYREDLRVVIERETKALAEAEKRLESYGVSTLNASTKIDTLTNGGNRYVETTKNVSKTTTKAASDLEQFEARLKSLGNVFTGIGDEDPTVAFGYLDTLGPKILQAETEINRKRLEITGTYGNEKLALEEQLRQAELALLDLQLEQELKMAGANTDEKLKIESEYALKRYDILSKSSAQVTDLDAEEAESKKTWLEMDLAERTALIQSYVDKIAEIATQATDVIATFNENAFASQQAEMDSYYEQQALQLEGSLANQKISQEQYDSDVREMDQRRREDQKRLDREAFERSKKIQIANATIAGAQAVLNAFASGVATPLVGPATGAIYAAIAAAFSAVQIGQIKAQPFTAARGGIVPGAGSGRVDTVNAMLAPGEAVINAQSTGAFLPVLNAINQLGGGKPLVATQNSQITQIAGYAQPQEVRAYVVERDMTEAQSRSSRLKRNARLFR